MGKAQLLLGHTETALPFLKQATNLNPDDSGAYYLLARAYKAQGLQREAAAAMERVQALHNSSLDAERRALKDAGIVKNAGVESGRPN